MKKFDIGLPMKMVIAVVIVGQSLLTLQALPQVKVADANTGEVFVDTHNLGGFIGDFMQERMDEKPSCSTASGAAMAELDKAFVAAGSTPASVCED